QTEFDVWASVISSSQWLISGDTAAIHLASVLGTRVLNLSVGPGRCSETGPYGNGHYVLAPRRPCSSFQGENSAHPCKNGGNADAAYGTWSYASHEWSHRRHLPLEDHFEKLGILNKLETVRILRSKIRATDNGGGVTYESQLQRPTELNDWVSMVMGHIAR